MRCMGDGVVVLDDSGREQVKPVRCKDVQQERVVLGGDAVVLFTLVVMMNWPLC
jgi:hypothetical protein